MGDRKLTDTEKAANRAAGLTNSGRIPKGPSPGFKRANIPNSKNGINTPVKFLRNDYRCLGTHFTPARKNHYLIALRRTGERALARAEVGVSIAVEKAHRSKDHQFRDAMDEALRQHACVYTQEMKRRGVDGIQEPVFGSLGGGPGSGTGVVGWVTKYSDRLLMAQAMRFEAEYTPKSKVETTITKVDGLGLEDLSPESQDDLRRILERELARREASDSNPLS